MNPTNTVYRSGNKALDHIASCYDFTASETRQAILSLPYLSVELWTLAVRTRDKLLRESDHADSYDQTILARCLFDLTLVIYFQEILTFTHDKELASLLVDALLFQATGCEAGSPTDEEFYDTGTQNVHGVYKYVLAAQRLKHVGDYHAWLFGSEVAALADRPKDCIVMASVASLSVMLRAFAKWDIQYILHGTMPAEGEPKAMEQALAAQDRQFVENLSNR